MVSARQVAAAAGLGQEAYQGDEEKDLSRENFGPGMECWIVCAGKGGSAVRSAKWGLVRSTQRDPVTSSSFFRMFNARSDRLQVVHGKLLGRKHCVVVFNGFYEWQKDDASGRKQPWYIFPTTNGGADCGGTDLLCMAGLWDEYVFPDSGEILRTFTIVTVDAGPKFRSLHDRMPAILTDQKQVNAWLSANSWNITTKACLGSFDDKLQWHPVTPAMGKTQYQELNCSQEIKLPKPPVTLTKMFSQMKNKRPQAESSTSSSSSSSSSSASSPPNVVKCFTGKSNEKEKKVVSSPRSPVKKKAKRQHGQTNLNAFFVKK